MQVLPANAVCWMGLPAAGFARTPAELAISRSGHPRHAGLRIHGPAGVRRDAAGAKENARFPGKPFPPGALPRHTLQTLNTRGAKG